MLPPAPPSVVDAYGRPLFGAYAGRIQDSSLRRLATVPRPLLALGQKRWIYVGVYGPELIAGCAVVDLTYMASAFAFAFDRARGRLVEHHHVAPRLKQLVPDTPMGGSARFSWLGSRVEIDVDVNGKRRVRAQIGRGDSRLAFDVCLDERGGTPLSLIAPQGRWRLGFTHKSAGIPATGSLRLGDRKIELSGADRAVVDYTHGIPPRHTHWLWASAAGSARDGRTLGLNLVSGWNEAPASENAAWIDGRLVKLQLVRFERPSPAEWLIRGDRIDLRFQRESQREQHVDLKLVASNYVQPIGRFDGELVDDDGSVVAFEGLAGVTEDHEARW